MAKITRIASAAAIASVDAVVALLSSGSAGRVDIMSGTQPADVDTAITAQVVLASLTLSVTAFAAAVDNTGNAQATANNINQDTAANAAGTATWFRAYDGNSVAIIDGNVGVVDEALVMTNVNIALNDTVNIATWVYQQSET